MTVISRSGIISLVVLHFFFIIGQAAADAAEAPPHQQGADRRVCRLADPPAWCAVPDAAKDTIFQDIEAAGADADNIGSLGNIIGLAWGGLKLLLRAFFFDYAILDASGPLGNIGLLMRWAGLLTLISTIASIGIGVLTRGR